MDWPSSHDFVCIYDQLWWMKPTTGTEGAAADRVRCRLRGIHLIHEELGQSGRDGSQSSMVALPPPSTRSSTARQK